MPTKPSPGQQGLFLSSLPAVERGQVWVLGRHRLMCGDATNKQDVAKLFSCDRPTLVVTSPPYADARNYNDPIACWDSMMLGAFDGHDFADNVQMLINLGPIHRKGEWLSYWDNWLQAMRSVKWKIFSQYIWDKLGGMPGNYNGRLNLGHEYIFHVHKQPVFANKIIECKYAGRRPGGKGMKGKNGLPCSYNSSRQVKSHKIADGVLRISPARNNKTKHPAVYPIGLASVLIKSWAHDGAITYDPFVGSGTTLLACEQESVIGLGMEISPEYVQMAIDRWRKMHPEQAVRLCE